MKPELDQLLFDRYPRIFVEGNTPSMQSQMRWGIACKDGWFDLLDVLCERLQFSTDHNSAPQAVAVQVKEKLGELRFYADDLNEVQRGMIQMATSMSRRICEQCGSQGQVLVYGHHHATLCREHAPDGAVTQHEFLAKRFRS